MKLFCYSITDKTLWDLAIDQAHAAEGMKDTSMKSLLLCSDASGCIYVFDVAK